jgi:hypothetical protein
VTEGEHAWVVDLPSPSGRHRMPAVTLSEHLWHAPPGTSNDPADGTALCAQFLLNSLAMTAWALDVTASLPIAAVPDEVMTLVRALLVSRTPTSRIRGRAYVVVAIPRTDH